MIYIYIIYIYYFTNIQKSYWTSEHFQMIQTNHWIEFLKQWFTVIHKKDTKIKSETLLNQSLNSFKEGLQK